MTNPMKEPKIISNFLSPRQNNLFGGVIPLDPSLCAGLWKCSSLLILNFIDNLGCFHQISEFQQISEKSSPEGSFWRNKIKFKFSAPSSGFPYFWIFRNASNFIQQNYWHLKTFFDFRSIPREFHSIGVCAIDRTDWGRTRSELKHFAFFIVFSLTDSLV